MTQFGGTEAAEVIAILAEISNNVNANKLIIDITKEATSCLQWAVLLESLMQDESIGQVYVRTHNVKIDPKVFDKVAHKLNDGKTILIGLLQTGGGDHAFAIEPLGDGKARILHGWQGDHPLRPEQSMPTEELCDTLKSLTKLEHKENVRPQELEKALCKLFGKDHARLGNTVVRENISFTSISEGIPRESLTSPANRARLRGLSEVIAPPKRARLSGSSFSSSSSSGIGSIDSSGRSSSFSSSSSSGIGSIDSSDRSSSFSSSSSSGIGSIGSSGSRDSVFLDDCAEAGGRGNRLNGVRMGTDLGSGLVFVLDVGGALRSGENVVLEGIQSGLGKGVAEGLAARTVKGTTSTFAKAGASIIGAYAAGTALFGVIAICDVVLWKMHKITGVKLRHCLAEGAGAAGGSKLGSAAAGVAGGVWLGPIGAGVGAVIGGIAGGIGGMFAGKRIDYAIWDEGEDAVMNSYEFFGWHDVDRNTRPKKNPEEMEKAYAEKLKNKPKKMEENDWEKVCLGTLMNLAKAMYPVFHDLIELANEVRENHSNALFVIATLVLEQSQIEEE